MFAGRAHQPDRGPRRAAHGAAAPDRDHLEVDGTDVVPEVHEVLRRVYEFADKVRDGRWTGVTGRAHPHGRQHRHRRLRPRPGDGLRGPRAVPPGGSGVPVHQQHRPDGRRDQAGRARRRQHAVHRLEQDLRHPRDAHQRPALPAAGCSSGSGDVDREGGRRRSTSLPSPPRSTRSPTSASTPTTPSASGTGSAAATPSTRPSAPRSWWRSARSASRTSCAASTRSTSTSARSRSGATCR